ncbi:MAG: hypothetical protein ACK6DB_09540, partial [Planctomycetota bacterium]
MTDLLDALLDSKLPAAFPAGPAAFTEVPAAFTEVPAAFPTEKFARNDSCRTNCDSSFNPTSNLPRIKGAEQAL